MSHNEIHPELNGMEWSDFLAVRRKMLAIFSSKGHTSERIAREMSMTAEQVEMMLTTRVPNFMAAHNMHVFNPRNDGWVIAKQTVVEMPDGKKELGYTTLAGIGVFTDQGDAIKSLSDLNLPLGWVIMHVNQLIPGYIMPPLMVDAALPTAINTVFTVRNYDDTYVESLLNAVAELSSDGQRFRTLMWLMESEQAICDSVEEGVRKSPQYANYRAASDIMEAHMPNNLELMRTALDAVARSGLAPNIPDKHIDSAKSAEVVRVAALALAQTVTEGYTVGSVNNDLESLLVCRHCGKQMPDSSETLDENHEHGCVVTIARQLIENES